MYGIIYKITCLVNSKIYIGYTTKTVDERFKQHIKTSKDENYKHASHLYRSMREYGVENFKVEVIDIAESYEEMCEKERYWISELDTRNPEIGMNIHEGGRGGRTGVGKQKATKKQIECLSIGWHMPMSDENKKLVSKIHKNKVVSEETREKLRKAQTGKKASEETRKKLSELRTGKKLPQRSDESKEKYRQSSKGRVHIHKGSENKNIKIEELEKYLSDGWERGYFYNNKKI